jgi:uncharacterized protein (TIGR02271 family)
MDPNLRRLGELDNFEVASDDPDVRGWAVKTRDGRGVGEVEELIVDPSARKVRYLEVDLNRDSFQLKDARRVSIPVESAQINSQDRAVFVSGLSTEQIAALPPTTYESRVGHRSHEGGEGTLLRSEEELHIGKRRAETGEVVVGKRVETERISQPVSVERERVNVERRPVEGGVRNARIEDDEIRVPVVEEEVVVEKRPVVKEELIVSKEKVQDVERVEDEVRKERFDIHKEGHVRDHENIPPTRRGGR